MTIGLQTAVPDGEDSFARELRNLRREFEEFKASRTLENAEIDNGPGKGIRTSDFDGTDFAHPGTTGNYFGGDGLVINHANFRPGSITNDWLASPVVAATFHGDLTNFSLATGANLNKIVLTVSVPSGFSQALVLGTSNMNAKNTTANADYGYVGTTIAGAPVGWSMAGYAPAGIYCSATHSATHLLTGLGSSFSISAGCSSSMANWSADSGNTMNLDAMVLFLR